MASMRTSQGGASPRFAVVLHRCRLVTGGQSEGGLAPAGTPTPLHRVRHRA